MAISAILDRILNKMEASYGEAKQANLDRYVEAKGIHQEMGAMFEPGGAFDIGIEKQLGRSKQQAVASGTQALVSSGLYSSTIQAGLGKKFEEEVGMPARERSEQYRVGQKAEAMRGEAGFIERRTDAYPDYGRVSQLAAQASSGPSGGGASQPRRYYGQGSRAVYSGGTAAASKRRASNPYMNSLLPSGSFSRTVTPVSKNKEK